MSRSPISPEIDARARLLETLRHAAEYLPAQAPLEVFVHHNTLHAFQHLPFHEGVAAAQERLHARGYMPEERYCEALARGRIREDDLEAVLAETTFSTRPLAPGFPSEKTLARLVTRHCIAAETPADLHWQVVEKQATSRFAAGVPTTKRRAIVVATDAWLAPTLAGVGGEGSELIRLADLARSPARGAAVNAELARLIVGQPEFRTPMAELAALLGTRARPEAFAARHEAVAVRALWTACVDACRHLDGAPQPGPAAPEFHRELLRACSNEDANDLVHTTLIPLCAAFLDRGQSHWSMPGRELGFFHAWRSVMLAGHSVRPGWLRALRARLQGWAERGLEAEAVVLELLTELGVGVAEQDLFLEQTLQQLRGWAGMFARLEAAPGGSAARVRLVDFLAVRLTLDVFAFQDIAGRLGHRGPVAQVPGWCAAQPRIAPPRLRGPHDTAWPLFVLAQYAGVAAPTIRQAMRADIDAVIDLLDRLDDTARQRLWHEAYERRYRVELLDAVAANREYEALARSGPAPRFQVMFCLDDRFESVRRHLEELSREVETFGVAGFFNLAIAYQGIDDPSTFPLCPVVVTPQHRVEEEPHSQHLPLAELRKQRLRHWGRATTLFGRASRSLLLGLFVSIASGVAAVVPLLVSVFAPALAGRMRQAVRRRLLPEPKTRLTAARIGSADLPASELRTGFSLDEKALRVGNLLEDIGLTRDFARVVAVLGHDSSSVNNPYFPAYSCGACGGRSGGPNARLFARMANRPEVRERLAARGIVVPAETVFVGGLYNTGNDGVRLFDVEALPAEAQAELPALQRLLAATGQHNAHERCRRFPTAPARPSYAGAKHHVEVRALDLSQARPELGHATNAACVVGRRGLTRGLFLDRRAFLVSYDPTIDPEGAVLERILAAVGPVGAGINLEYLFSTVDSERLGAGTKLPHNVTGLLGVMNGVSSDLRTGLPTQMTEIHEPVRMHLVVESTPEILTAICARRPAIAELVVGEWLRLAAVDPDSGQIFTFDARAGFRPYTPSNPTLPAVSRSRDWYSGHDGFLPPAHVGGPPLVDRGARHAS